MQQYNFDVRKPDLNAIIRRLNLNCDGKITFKEFSVGITPEYPGLDHEHLEFNVEKKQEVLKMIEEHKKTEIKDKSPSPLRDFRNIYNQTEGSPTK
jgi:hypothetical protein